MKAYVDAQVHKGYTLPIQCAQYNPSNNTVVYIGSHYGTASSMESLRVIYIPKTGIVRAVVLWLYAGTKGGNDSWTMNLRYDGGAGEAIATVALSSNNRVWGNYSMNLSVTAGHYLSVESAAVDWTGGSGSIPSSVLGCGSIYIE